MTPVNLDDNETIDIEIALRLDLPAWLSSKRRTDRLNVDELVSSALKDFRFETHTNRVVRRVIGHMVTGHSSPNWYTPVKVRVMVAPIVEVGALVSITGLWSACAVSSHEVKRRRSGG
ncbi:13.1 kDa [Spodoptera frugiperda ascovirus 1a]|uniref:13.1 kDa n=1 Tax=Spodoptera frugiperda ascovirus 1a TaxID=113370 RepID=Q0E538_SFAVA|nr:13.1 kDa [Spodoptera frugiperda ascovirus 1a]CAL44663.1 13.1 kDa [Spodoptera frugiperda ascovirus 1a]